MNLPLLQVLKVLAAEVFDLLNTFTLVTTTDRQHLHQDFYAIHAAVYEDISLSITSRINLTFHSAQIKVSLSQIEYFFV